MDTVMSTDMIAGIVVIVLMVILCIRSSKKKKEKKRSTGYAKKETVTKTGPTVTAPPKSAAARPVVTKAEKKSSTEKDKTLIINMGEKQKPVTTVAANAASYAGAEILYSYDHTLTRSQNRWICRNCETINDSSDRHCCVCGQARS